MLEEIIQNSALENISDVEDRLQIESDGASLRQKVRESQNDWEFDKIKVIQNFILKSMINKSKPTSRIIIVKLQVTKVR